LDPYLMKSATLVTMALVAAANAMKIGVLSDMHLDIRYDPVASHKDDCRKTNGSSNSSEPYAPLGRFKCDPPQITFEYMVQKLLEQEGSLDLVVVNGDHVGHGIALKDGGVEYSDHEVPLQMQTLQTVADTLSKYFPNTLVLPVIGNNDAYHHNEAPWTAEKMPYYTDVFKMWFNEIPKNSKLPNLGNIKDTFEYGGYYRVDVNSEVSVLSLNTMYLTLENELTENPKEGDAMLDWLETQLASAGSTRKFLI